MCPPFPALANVLTETEEFRFLPHHHCVTSAGCSARGTQATFDAARRLFVIIAIMCLPPRLFFYRVCV